jgi:hypothetical protein
MESLAEKVVAINDSFIEEQYEFLRTVAARLAEQVGGSVLAKWLQTRVSTPDWARDSGTYTKLRHLSICETRRSQPLPTIAENEYHQDLQRVQATL